MIRTRFKKVLLVAPEVTEYHLSSDYESVTHVHALNRIFPSIYELNPQLIVFDYNYISKDAEKIIRRIRTNNFYNKIKICCYKTKADTKTDSLLKTLGVDYFMYLEKPIAASSSKSVAHIFSEMLDMSVLGMTANAAN
jgi:DNA-binding response OmpR family regulator